MKFTEEQVKKFSRGSLIKKINAKEQNVVIETLDTNAIEQINSNVLKAIKDVPQKDPKEMIYLDIKILKKRWHLLKSKCHLFYKLQIFVCSV